MYIKTNTVHFGSHYFSPIAANQMMFQSFLFITGGHWTDFSLNKTAPINYGSVWILLSLMFLITWGLFSGLQCFKCTCLPFKCLVRFYKLLASLDFEMYAWGPQKVMDNKVFLLRLCLQSVRRTSCNCNPSSISIHCAL